jgi:hypothetical protein
MTEQKALIAAVVMVIALGIPLIFGSLDEIGRPRSRLGAPGFPVLGRSVPDEIVLDGDTRDTVKLVRTGQRFFVDRNGELYDADLQIVTGFIADLRSVRRDRVVTESEEAARELGMDSPDVVFLTIRSGADTSIYRVLPAQNHAGFFLQERDSPAMYFSRIGIPRLFEGTDRAWLDLRIMPESFDPVEITRIRVSGDDDFSLHLNGQWQRDGAEGGSEDRVLDGRDIRGFLASLTVLRGFDRKAGSGVLSAPGTLFRGNLELESRDGVVYRVEVYDTAECTVAYLPADTAEGPVYCIENRYLTRILPEPANLGIR